MHKKKVVIIGAGFAGLAAAGLLAANGYDVTVLEKNHEIGGRARVFRSKGFQFDRGPSWYMMPEIFENFFAEFGKKVEDFYTLKELDPSYQVFFEHEPPITISSDTEQTITQFDKVEKGAGKALRRYLYHARAIYEIAIKEFLYTDISNLWQFLNPKKAMAGLQLLGHLWPLQSWADLVAYLFQDHRLQKILTFPSVFLGGSPYKTPSLFSMLSWADMGKSIWYPKGGMTKVVHAFASLAGSHGAAIVCDAPVRSITIRNGEAIAVQTDGASYSCDWLIVATDVSHIQTLLPKESREYSELYFKKKTLAISAVLA